MMYGDIQRAHGHWVEFYRRAEGADRNRPHKPARNNRQGVEAINSRFAKTSRDEVINHLAGQLAEKLADIDAIDAEKGRRIAVVTHEKWLADNPCNCPGCS